MSFDNTDLEIRNKLAKSYRDNLAEQKVRYEQEKQIRIKKEQEDIFKVQDQIEREKMALQEKKRQIASLQYSDYLAGLEQKRLRDLHQYEDKQKADNVSLQMGSEERVNEYKNYISKLSDKIDRNAQLYNDYNAKNKNSTFLNPLTMKLSPPKQVNRTYNYENQYNSNLLPSRSIDYILLNNQNKKNFTHEDLSMGDYNSQYKGNVNDNKNYEEYREINKDFENYNKNLINQNLKFKEEMFFKRKLQEEERRKESERLMNLQQEEKMIENEKKRQYREYLDIQMQSQVPEKLKSESYSLSAVVKPNQFHNDDLYKYAPDYSFINKNKFVEVNPCKSIIII